MKSHLTATGPPGLPYSTHSQPIHHTSNRKIPNAMAGCVREEPTTAQGSTHYPILPHLKQLSTIPLTTESLKQRPVVLVKNRPTARGLTALPYATPTLTTYPPYL